MLCQERGLTNFGTTLYDYRVNFSCGGCGESLFPEERFCPNCGLSATGGVAVATPPPEFTPPPEDTAPPEDPAPPEATIPPEATEPPEDEPTTEPPPVDVSPLTRTQIGEVTVPCQKCGHGLGEIERFCPSCGTPVPGVEAAPRARPKNPWQQVRDRLEEVTAGRYRILEELGRGGMAAVYLAHEPTLNRKVAIKVMRSDLMLDPMMNERFLREARTMASFQHPNIVSVFAVESAEDLNYFVMQYVPGQALDRIIKTTGPLPVPIMQWVLYQAASALAYAHQAGVIHRDIKPGNILIDHRGNAIVTDFGIAKVVDASATSTTNQMGTPLYMSPEQCLGVVLTPASDQYALGNVAYEMLTGEPPFKRDAAIALAMAITSEKPKPIDAFRKDCPRDIGDAILRMLAKEPEKRWPTLAEAAAQMGGDHLAEEDPARVFLASLARAEAPSADRRTLTPRSPRTSTGSVFARALRRRRMIQVGVPIAVVVIGIVTGLLGYRRSLLARAGAGSVAAADSGALAVRPPAAVRPESTGVARGSVSPPLTASTRPSRTVAPSAVPGATPTATPIAQRPETVVVTRDAAANPVAPAPAPAPPPPVPVSHAAEIRQAIGGYASAINARSLPQLRAVFPGIKADQEARWKDLFSNEIEQLSATTTVRSLEERGDVADVTFLLTLVFKPKRDQPQTTHIASVATLRLENGAWKIFSLQTRAE